MTPSYKALTWDHPRGFRALQAAASEVAPGQGLQIAWDTQPLEGFESHPIADLCARYDLVVLDHPHVGEAIEADCLTPLEDIFPADELAALGAATIGPCLSSYKYAEKHWALPLDAATQVMAYRPDSSDALQTWDEVVAVAPKGGVALSLAGPHAILSYLSIASAFGEPPAELDPKLLVSEATGARVFDVLSSIYAHAERSTLALNPIGILAHMARHDDIHLCPLIYGYVNYTRQGIKFADAPIGYRSGSTLGGTGIGISRRCQITPELLAHLRWLMAPDAQRTFIPAHDGQPSRRSAWHDPAVNAAWGNFYLETAASLEAAYVRPRYPAYITWQSSASAYLRGALEAGTPGLTVAQDLNRMHRNSIGERER